MWILLGTVLINEVGTDWGLSETEAGLIVTIMMFGFLIGSYMWGFLSDKYGRMFSFRKTLLLAGICAIGVAASVNLPMLLVFILFAGIGVGGDLTVDGSVFVEFCPTNKRWMLTAMSAVMACGAVVVPLFAFIFVEGNVPYMWRYVTGVTAFFSFVFWGIRFFVDETPKWLLTQQMTEKAAEVLRKVVRVNGKSEADVVLIGTLTLKASFNVNLELSSSETSSQANTKSPMLEYSIEIDDSSGDRGQPFTNS